MINPVQAGGGSLGNLIPDATQAGDAPDVSFTDLLKSKVGDVNDAQINSEKMMEKFISGEDISPEKVMVAARKAEMMFQSLLEIRNKLTEAFDQIMRIQI